MQENEKTPEIDSTGVRITKLKTRSSGRRATLGFFRFRILTLYGLGFGVFKWAGVAAIRFRVNTPDSNWLNIGFGVSRRSVKNKMFCAHVVAHEPRLTTVSHKTVGRRI
jgi:hypothetical protein